MARLTLCAALCASPAFGDDPPEVEHQPATCAIPGKALSLCSGITDDAMVARARLYFRPQKDKFFAYVEMSFNGLEYCGTLPAAREGKARSVDYYIWAIDDQYNIKRTSTFSLPVQTEDVCGFAPLEKDPAKAASITVYATHKDQGKKLAAEFDSTGVTFVPSR